MHIGIDNQRWRRKVSGCAARNLKYLIRGSYMDTLYIPLLVIFVCNMIRINDEPLRSDPPPSLPTSPPHLPPHLVPPPPSPPRPPPHLPSLPTSPPWSFSSPTSSSSQWGYTLINWALGNVTVTFQSTLFILIIQTSSLCTRGEIVTRWRLQNPTYKN